MLDLVSRGRSWNLVSELLVSYIATKQGIRENFVIALGIRFPDHPWLVRLQYIASDCM
jgi:hypothetical protein